MGILAAAAVVGGIIYAGKKTLDHINEHTAPTKPPFASDEFVGQDKSTKVWKKTSKEEASHRVIGPCGARKEISRNLKVDGSRQLWIVEWTDPVAAVAEAQKYSGPKNEKGEGGDIIFLAIQKDRPVSHGPCRFEGIEGHEPILAQPGDDIQPIYYMPVTKETDQSFSARAGRCFEEHVKPTLSSTTPSSQTEAETRTPALTYEHIMGY